MSQTKEEEKHNLHLEIIKHFALKHLFLLISIITIFVFFIIFRKNIRIIAHKCFAAYGFAGLAAIVFVMDILIQPVSPDFLILSSTLGGANLIFASFIGGTASTLAGIIGYFIGRKLIFRGVLGLFSLKHLTNGQRLFKKYGIWAVAVGALSPVPYSAVCWSAGTYNMQFKRFLITSIVTRIPRFFIVAFIGFLFSH